MRYEMISADCHIDLCWLPPDLFVTNAASTEWRDRMPHVVDGPKGPRWTTKKGANLGLACGMGAAGREYVPGRIHRSDRMASTGSTTTASAASGASPIRISACATRIATAFRPR